MIVSTASSFMNTIGVNTHLNWGANYLNSTTIISELNFLGIHNVRDFAPAANNSNLSEWAALANAGVNFDFNIQYDWNVSNFDAQLDNFVSQFPGHLSYIEGPNEIWNWPSSYSGLTGMAAGDAVMQAIYTAIHGDSKLSGIPVVNLTTGGGTNAQTYNLLGNMQASANLGNVHMYPFGADPTPYDFLTYMIPLETSVTTPTLPLVITEAGYITMPDGVSGVNLDVQAKYTLNFLMDSALLGVKTTYLYELIDDASDPGNTNLQDHYGLFNADGSPKPVATAMHNLATILSDPGDNATTGTGLNYTVSGAPSNGHSLEFVKASGADDIVVWAEPNIWNEASSTESVAPVSNVTVSLGGVYQSVSIYDPMVGTAPIATETNVSSVTLAVTDHPLIIEIAPPSTSTVGTTVTTSSPEITSSSGGSLKDSTGNVWTLTSSGVLEENGTAVPGGAGTQAFAIVSNLYYGQDSASGQWYTYSATTQSWTSASAPNLGTTTSSDTLTLDVSEDAWKGDAQFTVTIDGKQVGGTLTASALHASGDANVFSLTGNWGSSVHDVQIQFINDAYGGTAAMDRNLYVNSIAYNGVTDGKTAAALMANGSHDFSVGGATAAGTAPADILVLHLAENAWSGDAQFVLTIDGKTITTPHAVTTPQSSGLWQDLSFAGNFGAGTHTIGVQFTNPGSGGTAATQRSLYVNGIDLNGQHYGSGVTSMLNATPATFTVTTTH